MKDKGKVNEKTRNNEKAKTIEQTKRKEELLGRKKSFKWIVPALVVVLALAVSWLVFRNGEGKATRLSGTDVTDKVNYKNQNLAMTAVMATVSGGTIELPLDQVKEKKLVSFNYASQGKQVPLMAYITPSGKLVTAVSMCEPCRSTKFHIEGNTMVCNTCFTRWDLETLEGLSGGCLKYPPDALAHKVAGNKILISEKDVLSWKPRI